MLCSKYRCEVSIAPESDTIWLTQDQMSELFETIVYCCARLRSISIDEEMRDNGEMDKFEEKILKTIRLCNEELANRKKGIVGECTEDQLENIVLPELTHILEMINNNQCPDKEKRYLNSFANAFTVWGWNMQAPTELFVLLTELNNEYKDF